VLRLQDQDTSASRSGSYFGSATGPLQERLFRLDKDVSSTCCGAARRCSSAEVTADAAPRRARHRRALAARRAAAPRRPARRHPRLYDKIAADRFSAARSTRRPALFGQFVSYFGRADRDATFYEKAPLATSTRTPPAQRRHLASGSARRPRRAARATARSRGGGAHRELRRLEAAATR